MPEHLALKHAPDGHSPPSLFRKSCLCMKSLHTILGLRQVKILKTCLGISFQILWVNIFQAQGTLQAKNNQSTILYAAETVKLRTCAEVTMFSD